MPVFRHDAEFSPSRGIRAFVKLEAGVVRGVPRAEPPTEDPPADSSLENAELRRLLELRERENAFLRRESSGGSSGAGVDPSKIVWIFGTARTGSTWFASMLEELSGTLRWNEPLLGDLFGNFYYFRGAHHVEKRPEDCVMGESMREVWLSSMRRFILNEVSVRYPELERGGYLFIKEPNGAYGAQLLLQALPESRVILLIRDPRDIVSSLLDMNKSSGWLSEWKQDEDDAQRAADDHPDDFVRDRADDLNFVLTNATRAYTDHAGKKTLVRYEDLREDAASEITRLLDEIKVPFDPVQIERSVEMHSWENVPEEKKGAGKFNRKAKPGGWREDLTPEQAGIIEATLGSFIEEYY